MRRARSLVAMVWLAFVARGFYYCVQQPLWEGLDEWAHFAALDYFAFHGRMPARTELVSEEIEISLELAPLAWSNNGWIAGGVNHDEFWQLPAAEREARRTQLSRLAAGSTDRSLTAAARIGARQGQYEGQQPPLYYALLAIPYRLGASWPLPVRVLWIRFLSLLMASVVIPIAYLIAREIPLARGSALPIAVFLAAMPAVLIFLARVGNDALAASLIAAAVLALLRASSTRQWAIAGLALGAALLTKGYALALLPLFLFAPLRSRNALAAPVVAFAAAGWWYLYTLIVTGTLAGDQLGVAAAATQISIWTAALHINWLRALDAGAMTHIWIGGWSFLQLRSWMYRIFELIAVAGTIGLAMAARRILRDARTTALVAAWVLVLCASAFFTVNIYRGTHVSGGVGWYPVAFCGVEAPLLAVGFAGLWGLRRARFAMAGVAGLALALDLYSVHFVLAPYYTGLIRHRANGAIEAFHPFTQGIAPAEIFHRLNWTGLPLAAPAWALYLTANGVLAWVILWSLWPASPRRAS